MNNQCLCLNNHGQRCGNLASKNIKFNPKFCWIHQSCQKINSIQPIKLKIPVKFKIPVKSKISVKSKILPTTTEKHINDFFTDNQLLTQDKNQFDCQQFSGPTPESNWIIRNKILAGGYPFNPNEKILDQQPIQRLINSGITDFICLQENNELLTFESYQSYLQPNKHTFHNFPIPDRKIVSDETMINYITQIQAIINQPNHIVYIHCYGGHGRTGVVIALLLGIIYNLSSQDALDFTQSLHNCRHKKYKGIKRNSPQTKVQFDQVKRILFLPTH